uniref:RING-type domain-containing protein n=1 Tax=Panagrolaimus sp. PS1159 TaxID=55785 RepID=A0AC35FV72_9BILA
MPGIGQCAICFSTLLSTEIYVVIKCGHTFHRNCILQWIHTGKNCSSCRVQATARDVIKLYIQETSLDDTFATQNNPEAKILELEAKLEQSVHEKEKIFQEKAQAESDIRTLNRKIKKLEGDNASIPTLRLRIQQMDSLSDNYAALQRELAEAKNKLNASEFYDMLTKKGKGPDEYKKYVGPDGAIIEKTFSRLLAKEKESYKQRLAEATATIKTLEKELKAERKISLERKAACHKLTEEFKKLNAKYENKRAPSPINPKLKDIINHSPVHKNPRKSLGFSFESPPISVNVLDSAVNDKRVKRRMYFEEDDGDDENDAEYRPSTSGTKPSPTKKQKKGFNFDDDDEWDSNWLPSSAPTISANSIPSPVAKFTRNASSAKNLGQSKKFGTSINDKRPLVTPSSKPTMKIQTRSMVNKNVAVPAAAPLASNDDSVICLD